jgi:hypothetical protein
MGAMTYPPSPNPLGMPHYDDLLADAVDMVRIEIAKTAGQLTPLEAEAAWRVSQAHARWTWETMADEVRLEWQNDGCLLGDDNGRYEIYDDQTPAAEVRPVMPAPGSHGAAHPVDTTIFYVQGVWHDVPMHYTEMQQLADATGARVIGIHNGAGPLQWISDAAQVLGDKLAFLVPPADLVHNKAADTVAHMVEAAATAHEPIVLFGHSHGALCISRGLRQADDVASGKDSFPGGVLGLVTVDTFGGAGLTYPVGPSYRHHMNADDHIVKLTGYGHLLGVDATGIEQFLDPSHPELHIFHDSSDGSGTDPNHHSFGDIYLRHFNPSALPQHTFPHHSPYSADADEDPAALTIELDDWESPRATDLGESASQYWAAEHQPDEGSHAGHPAADCDGNAYQLYVEKTVLPTRDNSWHPAPPDPISQQTSQSPTHSAHLDDEWSYADHSFGGWPLAHDPEQDEFDQYSRFDHEADDYRDDPDDDYDSDEDAGDEI